MVDRRAQSDAEVSWQALLGYLNFSEGRPDPRFQKQLNDAYRSLASSPDVTAALGTVLREQLHTLHASGASAFKEVGQVEQVVGLLFDRLLPAYRQHHADLLAHQSDGALFQPFFLARALEALLSQGPPWNESERIVRGALLRLNDFVGYRPIPILETRPRGEPYEHERFRPIPLYLRGAGVAWGRYHDLVATALEILEQTDASIRAEAQLDLQLLDELAFDPRAYDHGHPANRRPNHVFGEWDPHHLDAQGRYRRFVVRQLMLDSLLDRCEHPRDRDPAELLWEAGAVLAGVVLMASGIGGGTPTAFDSSATLSTLVPKIAAYRDSFYRRLLEKVGGDHSRRLRQEADQMKQPFGGARRDLNQKLAEHRATQLQYRHLSALFAEMGYPEPSRQHAARIATPSVRLHSEVVIRLIQADILTNHGERARAADLLPEAEDIIKRGIHCGAFADPWNILGYQGLFPLFQSREDTVRDSRVDDLLELIERLLDTYARLMSEASAAGEGPLDQRLRQGMRRLARWWDQFASPTVSDLRRVHGGEAAEAAEHVADALARWRQQGEATAGLGFWKQHQGEFRTAKAFAQVVDALLHKDDYQAALALLMSWLGQAEGVPLEEGQFSFHVLARRWLVAVVHAQPAAAALARKFFDYLEANADDYGEVPRLSLLDDDDEDEDADEDDNPYQAAYEGVVYHDSGDDGQEGSVLDDGPPIGEFALEEEAPRLEKRLRYLATLAQLWQMAARSFGTWRSDLPAGEAEEWPAALNSWLMQARENRQQLLALLEAVYRQPVPEPLGSFDSVVEYDRRRVVKEQLLDEIIGTSLETTLAVRALLVALENPDGGLEREGWTRQSKDWEPWALRLELALLRGQSDEAQQILPSFLQYFRPEPLLFAPLSAGGHPAAIYRARVAQAVLQSLLANLPRQGLLRETHLLLQTIRQMEQVQPAQGSRRVTEFDRLFRLGLQGVLESLIDSAPTWGTESGGDRNVVEVLKAVTRPFYRLWVDHSSTLQLSTLERFGNDSDWDKLRKFIQRYGRDLFHSKFLALGNLRGVLHRGIGAYLDYVRDNPEPGVSLKLLDELDRQISREQALNNLELILRALVENYEEFKDYNATTALAAYGENLHVLLDFLRIKANYDRQAWRQRPLVAAHEVLARRQRPGAARLWEQAYARLTEKSAEALVGQLSLLEEAHGIKLRTVSDRIHERLLKPLAIDRLCVLVEPAMTAALQQGAGDGAPLARFQEELAIQSATPAGSGLDVPQWLERLQQEVQRVRGEKSGGSWTRDTFLAPRQQLDYATVDELVREWEQDSDGGL
ncbi:MAG: hypothetical protein JNM56_34615 [Planctomycetia bacterium]|nr:hypothetical protein [Planctomycetia bacterium]